MSSYSLSDYKTAYCMHHFSGFSSYEDILEKLIAVQIDPISTVSPNQNLVFGSRCNSHNSSKLDELYTNDKVFEVYAKERCVILKSFAYLFADLVEKRRLKHENFLKEYNKQLIMLLDEIERQGQMSANDFKSFTVDSAASWGTNKFHTKAIYVLWQTGFLNVDSRKGRKVFYKKVNKGFWDDLLDKSKTYADLKIERAKIYVDSCGIVDARDKFLAFDSLHKAERDEILNILIEDKYVTKVPCSNSRNIIVASKKLESYQAIDIEARLVPPLDNSIWNRQLILDLFDFEYVWEAYKPKDKRVFGAYAMPLLADGELCGPIDVAYSRKEDSLNLVINKERFQNELSGQAAAIEAAAYRLAEQLGAKQINIH